MSETVRRYKLGEAYTTFQLKPAGTTVVRPATVYGYGAMFRTTSPCCNRAALIDAQMWGDGKLVTCVGCKWKWEVFLALGDQRIGVQPRGAKHPHIEADRAEWVSRGFGTRHYRRHTGRWG